MKRFFARNIDGKSRLVRGLLGLALLVGVEGIFQYRRQRLKDLFNPTQP